MGIKVAIKDMLISITGRKKKEAKKKTSKKKPAKKKTTKKK